MDPDTSGDDDEIRAALGISSFGAQTRETNVRAQINSSKRQSHGSRNTLPELDDEDEQDEDSNSDGEEDDEDDEDDEDEEEFPVSHELVLKTHERAVTSVTVDSSGARLITGSTDCTLKLHDFASMTPTTLRAFRTVDPTATKMSAATETHPIHHVEFNSLSPSQVLVIAALPQAKIFSRDGEEQTQFVKGDMYLRDLNNTKGHISEITSGTWHPTNRDLCVTAGTDSTLRIWDVNNKRAQKEVIVFKSKVAGAAGRTRMTAVSWGSQVEGGPNILIAAALDGSLVMYDGDGPHNRPSGEIRDAHARNTWTSGLDISSDGRLVVSRGGDDTVKLWDTRKFKQPISTAKFPSISSQYPTANIQFSPSSSNIILGSETGHLHILNPATLKPELSTPVTPGSPLITVLWHSKLNQIISGSANGETHVLYSPTISQNGAKITMSRAPKRRHIDDDPNFTMDLSQGISGDSIITPGGILPSTQPSRHSNIGLTASGKSRDPRRPHLPATTPFAKTQPDERHIRENIPLSSMKNEDPRLALLKYATDAEKKTWEESQNNSSANVSDEEVEPEKKRAKLR